MQHNCKKIILNLLNLVLFIFVCVVIYKLNALAYKSICFYSESLYEPYWNPNNDFDYDTGIYQVFHSQEQNWYINSVFQVLTQRYLHQILNIHPIIYAEKYFWIFLYGILLLLLFLLKENFTKYFTHKKFLSPIAIPIFLIIINLAIINHTQWIFSRIPWCSNYIFLMTFSLCAFSRAEYFYVTNIKPLPKDIFILVFLFVCTSFCHEFFRFIICFGLFVGFFIHRYFFKTKIKPIYALFWLGIVIINSMTFFTSSFKHWFWLRCVFNKDSFFRHTDILNIKYLSEYFNGYFNLFFVENLKYYIILALLFILIYFFVKDKDSNKRLFIFVSSVLLSVFAFFIVIIVGNEYTEFAYQHPGLIWNMNVLMFFLILSCSGYLIHNIDNLKIKTAAIIIPFLALIYGIDLIEYNHRLEEFNEDVKNIKREIYINEKFFVLYEKAHRDFYAIRIKHNITELMILYLFDMYDRSGSLYNYDITLLCETSKTVSAYECENKLIEKFEEKTGQKFTEEELNNPDFTVFEKYRHNI